MTSGGNRKDGPRGDGEPRGRPAVDPVKLGGETSSLDDGWDDLGLDDLLGPDEGPTVVDGSLEMAAAEMAGEQPTREPARTFLGMGPQAQVVPDPEEEISGEERTEVGVPALPEEDEPGTLDGLASQAEEPATAQSPLASLASQDVAFKDTLLPSEPDMAAMAPRPMAPQKKARPHRPTPPPTEEVEPVRVTRQRVSAKPEPDQTRPVAETKPSTPVVRRRTGQGEDGEVAMAATMAPGELDSMAMAPTLAPDPDAAVLRVPPAPEPEPPRPKPEPQPPVADTPAAPKPQSEEPTQTVKPMAKPRGRGAPSNLTLTILWVLALLSVMVAVALYLFRP